MAKQFENFTPAGASVKLECDVTAQDFFDALVLQQRAKGAGKRYFQMGLALALAFGMFYSWLQDTTYTMWLFLTAVCILLFWALLFLPGFMMKRTAALMAEHIQKLEFTVYENGVVINDGLGELMLPAEGTVVCENLKLYLFEDGRQQAYPLLIRSMDRLQKKQLDRILENWPGFYVFSEVGDGKKKSR